MTKFEVGIIALSGFLSENCFKGIMNGHFKRLFSEITSVCGTILRLFNIITLQQRNLDMQDQFMPRYSLPTKTYPVLNEKRSFLCKCYHRILVSINTGLRRLNFFINSISKQGIQHNLEQQNSSNWVIYGELFFTGLCSSNIPRYFLDFALQ